MTDWVFVRRVLTVFAIGALALALWVLADLVLVIFAAVLCSIALRTMTAPIVGVTNMPQPLALALVVILTLAVGAGLFLQFGGRLVAQTQYLLQEAPAALKTLTAGYNLDALSDSAGGSVVGGIATGLLTFGTSIVGAAASAVLIVVGGLYLAGAPEPYKRGFVALFPTRWHEIVSSTLEDSSFALSRWLKAQLISMCVVGVATGAGMWLAGVPSPLALGLIAGGLAFIPYIGPILAAVPALLLASTGGWDLTVAALVVTIAVQQLENNLIMPLVVGRVVELPAAVGLFATVAMGLLFGPLGFILGYPLAIFADVAIRRLYVREALGKTVDIPAERERHAAAE
jgi:predicted PurR-regulated permease PerM